MEIKAKILSLIKDLRFDLVGWTRLERPLTMDFYKSWIEAGCHGDMKYLKEHQILKEHPQFLNASLKSALVIARQYVPHPHGPSPFPSLRVAAYAQGEDYHHWLKRDLLQLCQSLQLGFTNDVFLPFVDSGPVLERDLARKANLGWIGKNTCLIHPEKGSFIFLGEILTSLDLSQVSQLVEAKLSPTTDHCGTCRKCLDACPTGALVEPRKLDSRLCISYWTIESKSSPPEDLRSQMGSWFFGCDLCQTVCPWNSKIIQTHPIRYDDNDKNVSKVSDLRWILSSSNRMILKKLRHTPLLRAGPWGLKRNALIITANERLQELQPEVEALAFRQHRLQQLAQWSLEQLLKKCD